MEHSVVEKLDQKNPLQGLSCSNCGGMIEIPEGEIIIICPFCNQRSLVRGNTGIRRYQVPVKANREYFYSAISKFLVSNADIAKGLTRRAEVIETFIVFLPFWAYSTQALAWHFGKLKSENSEREYTREVKINKEYVRTGVACDAGEFGIDSIRLKTKLWEPFEPEILHSLGMVFEPTGSPSQFVEQAKKEINRELRKDSGLTSVTQKFVRFPKAEHSLVYYPFWIGRYEYKKRHFQVVMDGVTGRIVFGKAPGDTLYRALKFIGGMAIGSILTVQLPCLISYLMLDSSSSDIEEGLIFALGIMALGMATMVSTYRKFRFGEHYEYRAIPNKIQEDAEGDNPIILGILDALADTIQDFIKKRS